MKLDAKNQRLGRLASKTAKLLIEGEKVEINNITEIEQTSKNKIYYSHSGYPGGFKTKTYQEIGPKKAFEKAVWGMLPKNKLRKPRIKNLIIND
ncbi:MAG: uL13 family ribosomal protein [bacterium]